MVTKTIKVLDIYSKPQNKKSKNETPAKGATPAKKQKLGLVTTGLVLGPASQKFSDPSANQNTPVQNEVTKQLHALLNNIPAENLSKLEKLKKTSGKLLLLLCNFESHLYFRSRFKNTVINTEQKR